MGGLSPQCNDLWVTSCKIRGELLCFDEHDGSRLACGMLLKI